MGAAELVENVAIRSTVNRLTRVTIPKDLRWRDCIAVEGDAAQLAALEACQRRPTHRMEAFVTAAMATQQRAK